MLDYTFMLFPASTACNSSPEDVADFCDCLTLPSKLRQLRQSKRCAQVCMMTPAQHRGTGGLRLMGMLLGIVLVFWSSTSCISPSGL